MIIQKCRQGPGPWPRAHGPGGMFGYFPSPFWDVYVYICVFICIFMFICVYLCMYIYIYTYTNIPPPLGDRREGKYKKKGKVVGRCLRFACCLLHIHIYVYIIYDM